MSEFEGFPNRMEFTPLPNLFFSALLPRITDMAELKVTLQVMAALYRKRGYPRFVTFGELAGASLMEGIKEKGKSPRETLRKGLEAATGRGTFLHLELDRDGEAEHLYFLNDSSGRQAVARIESGELKLSGLKPARQTREEKEEQPGIFALYEQNIGMLTPMIADELREAEKLYPEEWLRDAIREAVNNNKRKWSYISAILKNWAAEGKGDGTYPRHHKKTDPDKYIRGKYGHMVQR